MVVKLQCQSCSGYVELLKNTKTRYKSRSLASKKARFIKDKVERRQYPPNCTSDFSWLFQDR